MTSEVEAVFASMGREPETDPLSDTPGGDHEFMNAVRWVESLPDVTWGTIFEDGGHFLWARTGGLPLGGANGEMKRAFFEAVADMLAPRLRRVV